jgi:phage I-like protein
MKKGALETWLLRGHGHQLVRVALKSSPPYKAPTEFRIFTFGLIETDKGDFQFTKADAELVLADRENRPLVALDFDHRMAKPSSTNDARGAGHCRLELRNDGLWAVDVSFTPTALKQVQDGEWLYFSPFFGATKDGHHIVQLMNIALTGIPAMKNLGSLIAASRFSPKETYDMAHKLGGYLQSHMKKSGLSLAQMAEKCSINADRMQKLSDGDDPSEEEMKAACKAMGVESLSAFDNNAPSDVDDGSEDDDGEDDAEEAKKPAPTAASRSGAVDEDLDLVELTGTTDPKKQAARIKAWQLSAKQNEKNTARLEKLEKSHNDRERKRLLDEGKAAGKLTPKLISFYASRSNEELEEFLKHAPVIFTTASRSGAEDFQQVDPNSPVAQLTREEIEVCKLSHSDPEELAKFKAELAAGKTDAAILKTYLA